MAYIYIYIPKLFCDIWKICRPARKASHTRRNVCLVSKVLCMVLGIGGEDYKDITSFAHRKPEPSSQRTSCTGCTRSLSIGA